MLKTIIPPDSLLHTWCRLLSATEVPLSYQLCVGLSTLGMYLKRSCWIDQHAAGGWGWNVWPNQSVLLVGPSGVGKDTIIHFATKEIQRTQAVPVLGGTTIEGIYARLVGIGTPAAAYLPVGEMAAFFGSKDYQSNLVQDFTDLLSSGERKDVSTKGDLFNGGAKIIHQPTLTMHCGTTEEWLHKAMPEGTLEGGFLGRFLIVVEGFGKRFVPLPKYSERSEALDGAEEEWIQGIEEVQRRIKSLGEVYILEEARQIYENWYYNRFRLFSRAVLPYANRSRDTVLRLAMVMGISRRHWGWIDQEDMQFAIQLMGELARKIDLAVVPPTKEAQCAQEILKLLPARGTEVLRIVSRKWDLRLIQQAEELLRRSNQLKVEGGRWLAV